MKRLSWLEYVISALMLIGFVGIFASVVLALACMHTGSLIYDAKTEHTFAVQMHGTLYVQPWLGRAYEDVSLAAWLLTAAGFALQYWRDPNMFGKKSAEDN